MTPSELAGKLEQGGIFRITPEEEALRNKCVRFAADMEVLMPFVPSFWRSENGVFCGYNSPCGLVRKRAEGDDIYTAARKAVEAMEEKR